MIKIIKNKLFQSKCPHEWHKVADIGKLSIWTEFHYVTALYCPLCDKNRKMKDYKAKQLLKKQEIKLQYSNNFRV